MTCEPFQVTSRSLPAHCFGVSNGKCISKKDSRDREVPKKLPQIGFGTQYYDLRAIFRSLPAQGLGVLNWKCISKKVSRDKIPSVQEMTANRFWDPIL